MKLSNQAIGSIMMALQKSLMEQSDIVPTLTNLEFQVVQTNIEGREESLLQVLNPPVVSLEGVTPPFTIEETAEEEDTNA